MDVGALLSPQTVLLADGATAATIYPVWDGSQLPLELVASLWVEYNAEIDLGRSFPETHKLMLDSFEKSWFAGVAGVMVRGGPAASLEDLDFLGGTECFGSFYIEPCFPGRSSHICTAKFLVNSRLRSRGIGSRLASCFMDWAPRLGYDYALFNLVYATNISFCRILNRLGFRTLSRLKGAGILNGYNYPVDALQFGRWLLSDEDVVAPQDPFASLEQTEQQHRQLSPLAQAPPISQAAGAQGVSSEAARAPQGLPVQSLAPQDPVSSDSPRPNEPKLTADPDYSIIKLYLETGAYPENASRLEKTRLRSRSRSYYVENHELMFKRNNARVVADPYEQLRIAASIHRENHNGINNMQKKISSKYYWAGMRDTITRVIHQCPECRAASQTISAVPKSRDYNPQHSPVATTPQAAVPSDALSEEGATPYSVQDSVQDSGPMRPPRDPYESGHLRWDNVVYLLPDEEDYEYVPETEQDFAAAVAANRRSVDELFHDDEDMEGANDDEDDDEYVDEGNDDDDEDAEDGEGNDEEGDDDEGDEGDEDADPASTA